MSIFNSFLYVYQAGLVVVDFCVANGNLWQAIDVDLRRSTVGPEPRVAGTMRWELARP